MSPWPNAQREQATETGSASTGVNRQSFAEARGVKRVQERPKLGQSDARLLLCSNVRLSFLLLLSTVK